MLAVGVALCILGGLVLGYCIGCGVNGRAYRGAYAELAEVRAEVEAERHAVRGELAAVQVAAAEAIDTIDAMQGLAQVETLLKKREPVR